MRHRQAIALLALVGFFVSLYLWLHAIGATGPLRCGPAGGCDAVQASPYARLLGLPVALYGVVGYAALLAVSVAGLQPRFAAQRGPTALLAGLATAGFGFTLYLKYVELFVIEALCRWCLASALIITAIWATAVVAWLKTRSPRIHSRSRAQSVQ